MRGTVLAFVLATAINSSVIAAPFSYDEALSGDLSAFDAPLSVSSFDVGVNTVTDVTGPIAVPELASSLLLGPGFAAPGLVRRASRLD